MTFDIREVKSGDLILFEEHNQRGHYKIHYLILKITDSNHDVFAASALDLSVGMVYDGLFKYKMCSIVARPGD